MTDIQSSWQLRFSSPPPEADVRLAHYLSHRSVRRFSDRPISEADIQGLVAAGQSAATSSNLQSWSLVSVQNSVTRQKLADLCGGQKQIVTAPWFFAFIADLNRIEQYSVAAGVSPDALDTIEMYTVAVIDAALAAERMVCAAEAIGLGICYIGALRNHPYEVMEQLRLPLRTAPVFGLCLGYPAESANATIKPRLNQDQMWFRETYPETLDSSE
jgi:nitroreductase